jgi:adenylyltransferase/sulfurtransferase
VPVPPASLDPDTLRAIYAHATQCYPAECCGLVTDAGLRRSRNVMDEMHALDPDAFPRTSRTGFQLAAADQLFLARSMHSELPVRVVYHSHVDVGAYFSAADRAGATLDGEPLHRGLQHLVVDAQADGVRGARLYAHEGGDRFREVSRFDERGEEIPEIGDRCGAARDSSS